MTTPNEYPACPGTGQPGVGGKEETRLELSVHPYRPANGLEGIAFEETYCDHCKHNTDVGCEIWDRALMFELGDPEYPTELVEPYDDGPPFCTAFEDKDAPPVGTDVLLRRMGAPTLPGFEQGIEG